MNHTIKKPLIQKVATGIITTAAVLIIAGVSGGLVFWRNSSAKNIEQDIHIATMQSVLIQNELDKRLIVGRFNMRELDLIELMSDVKHVIKQVDKIVKQQEKQYSMVLGDAK